VWLREALKAGKKAEDFLIAKSPVSVKRAAKKVGKKTGKRKGA
jgi:hypothetical protein